MKRLGLALALAAAGCGGDREEGYVKSTFPLKDVPENILKVAAEEHQGRTITDALKKSKKDGAFVSYEIRAKDPNTGKTHEVGIAPDGKVLDRE